MISREIGGYFELERFRGKSPHPEAVALNSGRGAILYLCELRSIDRVWVPDFMCDSVPRAFRRGGAEVLTYRIGKDFLPIYDFEIAPDSWMLLMDYYGQLRQENVTEALSRFPGRVIVDETQDFFREPWAGCDVTYSCRKWFGVSDGAYLVTSDGARLPRELPLDSSGGRMDFVFGRLEKGAGEFYSRASENNKFFDDEPSKLMSPVTGNLMRGIDYGFVAKRRCENWVVLDDALRGVNLLALRMPDAPFMYPLFVDCASSLRRELIKEGVFVPTLWPNVLEDAGAGSVARRLARDVVPLPLDQRYGEEEMDFVVRIVLERLHLWCDKVEGDDDEIVL